MRVSSLSLLALAFLLGCSSDGAGTSATTSPTTDPGDGSDTTGTTTGDGPDTTSDGPETTTDGPDTAGDGDGDGDSICVQQCTSDPDCLIDGIDTGLTCFHLVCTDESLLCTDDHECVARYSGWTTPCTAGGGECDGLGQICIGAAGGRCAKPSDVIDCAALGMEEMNAIDINLNPVMVCGQPDASCHDDSFCYLPCAGDDDCIEVAYPVCDVGSGLCQCGEDADCATFGLPQLSVCNAGTCGCSEDQDCVDANAGDICTSNGDCGCSGDMACTALGNRFDGGMYACVQL